METPDKSSAGASVAGFLVTTAAFIIVIAGMRAASELLVPFLTSVFIAVICMPPIAYLRKYKVPNGLAVTAVVAFVVIVAIGLGAIFGQAGSQFSKDMPEYQLRLAEIWNGLILKLVSLGVEIDVDQLKTMVQPEKVFPMAGNLLGAMGNLMADALVILLFVVFLLTEEVGLKQKFKIAFPGSETASFTITKVANSINQYMAIKAAVSALTGFLIWLILVIIGVDYPILWGTLAFLLNFIPTFGSLIAAVPTVLLALVQLGPLSAVFTALGYFVVNTLVGNVIEPRVMGKGLGLSAFVVLISLVFWGWVLGTVGMLLSVPLTVMVKIGLELSPDTRWIAILLGDGSETVKQEILDTDQV